MLPYLLFWMNNNFVMYFLLVRKYMTEGISMVSDFLYTIKDKKFVSIRINTGDKHRHDIFMCNDMNHCILFKRCVFDLHALKTVVWAVCCVCAICCCCYCCPVYQGSSWQLRMSPFWSAALFAAVLTSSAQVVLTAVYKWYVVHCISKKKQKIRSPDCFFLPSFLVHTTQKSWRHIFIWCVLIAWIY